MYLVDYGCLVLIHPRRSCLVDNLHPFLKLLLKAWLEVLTSKVAMKESHLLEVEENLSF